MSLCIVIPMKDPLLSKQRLSQVLAPNQRQSVAINLLHKTLAFLSRHFADIDILVVTPCQSIAAIAKGYQAAVLLEEPAQGLNHAVSSAAQHCTHLGYDSMLILPADIITLNLAEFSQLVSAPRAAQSIVICASQDGGSNALISSPPDVITFSYGRNSANLHLESARQQGISCLQLSLPELAIDLDTATDLAQLSAGHIAQLTRSMTSPSLSKANLI